MLSHPLNVGIAGLGTVGASVVRILERRANALALATGRAIHVAGVSARTRDKNRDVLISKYKWFDDPIELASSPDIDVFVEAIGGKDGPAFDSVNRAIDCGKAVVTANKALLANHGMKLAAKAEAKDVVLNFEAVVAGGIPIIKQLREALVGNSIEKIYGILNGTCNYILTEMTQEGLSFDEALGAAQKLGYAEADPRTDVEGLDAAHKLAVLATLAFGIKLDPTQVHYEGITGIRRQDIVDAKELGYQIKLLGIAERFNERVLLRVHPALVPDYAPLSQVNGVLNAVSIKADAVDLTSIGPGAGGEATASAVVADIADIARGHGLMSPLLRKTTELEDFSVLPIRDHRSSFYISMVVEDRVGVFAAIANEMARQEISLESIKQIGPHSRRGRAFRKTVTGEAQTIVLITHEASENSIEGALAAIRGKKFVRGVPKVIRIEY